MKFIKGQMAGIRTTDHWVRKQPISNSSFPQASNAHLIKVWLVLCSNLGHYFYISLLLLFWKYFAFTWIRTWMTGYKASPQTIVSPRLWEQQNAFLNIISFLSQFVERECVYSRPNLTLSDQIRRHYERRLRRLFDCTHER